MLCKHLLLWKLSDDHPTWTLNGKSSTYSLDVQDGRCVNTLTNVSLLFWRLHKSDELHVDVDLHPQNQTHFKQHQLELTDTWKAHKHTREDAGYLKKTTKKTRWDKSLLCRHATNKTYFKQSQHQNSDLSFFTKHSFTKTRIIIITSVTWSGRFWTRNSRLPSNLRTTVVPTIAGEKQQNFGVQRPVAPT